jgi:hypothetical protein
MIYAKTYVIKRMCKARVSNTEGELIPTCLHVQCTVLLEDCKLKYFIVTVSKDIFYLTQSKKVIVMIAVIQCMYSLKLTELSKQLLVVALI